MVEQNFAHISKDTYVVQDIDAYIKEESKNFKDADNIIAEFLPQVRDTSLPGKISDSRLIHAENHWKNENYLTNLYSQSFL